MIKLRKKQAAFHPNATQFTLQLNNDFFGIWRQSIDRSQSIFCISNLTKNKKSISLLDINLIPTNEWFDIISQTKIKNINGKLFLNLTRLIGLLINFFNFFKYFFFHKKIFDKINSK